MRRISFLLLLILTLLLLSTVGCFRESPAAQETRSRIEQKAETAKGLIRKRAQAGEDISGILQTMEAAGSRFEKGDVEGGEALLDQALARLQSEESLEPQPTFSEPATDIYQDPQRVTVQGYDASQGIMEPFITRDGQYLLVQQWQCSPQHQRWQTRSRPSLCPADQRFDLPVSGRN